MLYQGIIGGGSSPVEPVDLSPVLLWTNPSPTSTFAAQTVNLDLAEYAGVIVEFNAESTYANRVYIKKTDSTKQIGGVIGSTNLISREVSISSGGVSFGNSMNGNLSTNNNMIIPTKIYGVKEYVVEAVSMKKLGNYTGNQTIDVSSVDGYANKTFFALNVGLSEDFYTHEKKGERIVSFKNKVTLVGSNLVTSGFTITYGTVGLVDSFSDLLLNYDIYYI